MCGIQCGQSYKWSITHRERTVQGGWALKSVPSSVTTDELQFAWASVKRSASSPNAAVKQMEQFLRINGIDITPELSLEIMEQADMQYCSAEPSRCPSRLIKRSPAMKVSEGRPDLPWARGFWEAFNVLVATDQPDPATAVDRMALTALALISGVAGCQKCADHWRSVYDAAPPMTTIQSNNDARVWVWRAHNISRQRQQPVPFEVIARKWQWAPLTDGEVADAVQRMGMADIE